MRFMELLACPVATVMNRRSPSLVALISLLSAAVPFSILGWASSPDRGIKDLYHKSWTAKDGAPARITSLARAGNGYLYIGTVNGLYQFDGVTFERFAPSVGEALTRPNISNLFPVSNGGVWISYASGGVAYLKEGRVTNYLDQDGAPMGPTFDVIQDTDGKMWKRDTERLLSRFDGSKWHALAAGPTGDCQACVNAPGRSVRS